MTTQFPAVLAAIGDMDRGRLWAIVLGVFLAIVAIALLVASWTKWGQTKSLTKCIALALLAHVWLFMYAYGTRIITPGSGGGNQGGSRSAEVAFSVPMMLVTEQQEAEKDSKIEEVLSTDEDTEHVEPRPNPWEAPLQRTADFQRDSTESLAKEILKLPELSPTKIQMPALSPPRLEVQELDLPAIESAEQILQLASLPVQASLGTFALREASVSQDRLLPFYPPLGQPKRHVDQQPVPPNYQMRLSPNKLQFAMQNGGDVNTETAVELALEWLARAQGPDGGWNAAEHGAGRESVNANQLEPENRHNAGLKANTAMTGLSLLAFLGAGHTHADGKYKETVSKGLRYLLSQQWESGDLSGRDQIGHEPTVRFARMYSHGMAALALAESYGMTGDPALLPAVDAACKYSMKAMNPQTGGWRYEFPTSDPGDLSQFGWQALLLSSASNHQSFALPPQSKFLMQRFLDSVSTGRHGGLAVYRPRSGQIAGSAQATPAMTAEAIASRLMLNFPLSQPAAEEGQNMLLKNLPGRSEENLYYWYYATLAMYQLRAEKNAEAATPNDSAETAWSQWNDALKQQLCSSQVPRGQLKGSWNPTCIWGGYGGRVYSTAIACMCLEVYYRYLPMYKPDDVANQWQGFRR